MFTRLATINTVNHPKAILKSLEELLLKYCINEKIRTKITDNPNKYL